MGQVSKWKKAQQSAWAFRYPESNVRPEGFITVPCTYLLTEGAFTREVEGPAGGGVRRLWTNSSLDYPHELEQGISLLKLHVFICKGEESLQHPFNSKIL